MRGPKSYVVTRNVPQRSVLGLLLWDVLYDGVLVIIAYADEIAVAIVEKELSEIQSTCKEVIRKTKDSYNE